MIKKNKIILLLISFIFFVFFIIVVFLSARKKSVSSPTPSPQPSSTITTNLIQQKIDQTIYDVQFAQETKEIVNKYPFITKLPIITNKYNILFEFQSEKIKVVLKLVNKEEVQNEIDLKLKEIGVDTIKYPIIYISSGN
jgi:galactitol-specific phosphotransferase system IIB component